MTASPRRVRRRRRSSGTGDEPTDGFVPFRVTQYVLRMVDLAPNAPRFPPLDEATAKVWAKFPQGWDRTYFPNLVGLVTEEIRTDYARMRLPFRPELEQ